MKTIAALIVLSVWVVGVIGWIINIVKLIAMVGQPVETALIEFILRIVGVPVVPLGAIMGLFV